MRIQPSALPLQLKKGLAPLYFVFGDEPHQHKEAVDAIRSQAKLDGYLDREIFDVTAHFDWSTLFESLKARSLFSSKRLIECRLLDNKVGKTGSDYLSKLEKFLSPDLILLVTAGKIEAATQKSLWFTTLERLGTSVTARALFPNEVQPWWASRLSAAGYSATNEVIHALFLQTEGNLLSSAEIIEKLPLFFEKGPLTLAQVTEIIENNSRYSLFELVDAVFSFDIPRTNKIFTSLRNEGVELILILWALTKEVRIVLTTVHKRQQGISPATVFKEYGVWARRVPLLLTFLDRVSLDTLTRFFKRAKEIDDILKGRVPGDASFALRHLCLSLAGATYDS